MAIYEMILAANSTQPSVINSFYFKSSDTAYENINTYCEVEKVAKTNPEINFPITSYEDMIKSPLVSVVTLTVKYTNKRKYFKILCPTELVNNLATEAKKSTISYKGGTIINVNLSGKIVNV